jgi:hypothetical protein
MKKEYPLSQAAARAGMDQRSFRLLADRRIVLATPRTRTQGRGKQKLYSTDEVLIASILAPLVKLGADTFSLGELADWLRGNLGSREFEAARRGAPVYVRLRYSEADSWGAHLYEARSFTADANKDDASNFFLPATEPGSATTTWAREFIAVKLDDRIRRVEWDFSTFFRANNTPSQTVKYLSEPDAREAWTKETTEEEFDALFEAAEQAMANGDKWPDE